MAYNDDGNRTVKNFVHMLAALAFVPISDVEDFFATLIQKTPANMREYVDYFDTTYMRTVNRLEVDVERSHRAMHLTCGISTMP